MSQPRRAVSAFAGRSQQSPRRARRLSPTVIAASMLAGSYATIGTAMGQTFTGTFTWNNPATESWFNAANWNDGTGGAPSLTDDTVSIPAARC